MSDYKIQTILFDKSKYDEEKAKDFLKKHDFSFKGFDEKENTLRARQLNPSYIKKLGYTDFRTILFSDDIKAVVAYRRGTDMTPTIQIQPIPEKKKKGGTILFNTPIRRDYSPAIRKFLNKIGNKKIINMAVQRVPIDSNLQGLLNAISLGTYNKQTEKLGYDEIFHLSLIIQLANKRKPIVVEKNEVINISNRIPPLKKGGERMNIPVNKSITLNQLLDNTREKQGTNFFLYDAFKRNCQMFINDLLTNSGLNNPELQTFILQDAEKILKGLPFYFSSVARGLTDLGGQFNTILYGRGNLKKKSLSNLVIKKKMRKVVKPKFKKSKSNFLEGGYGLKKGEPRKAQLVDIIKKWVSENPDSGLNINYKKTKRNELIDIIGNNNIDISKYSTFVKVDESNKSTSKSAIPKSTTQKMTIPMLKNIIQSWLDADKSRKLTKWKTLKKDELVKLIKDKNISVEAPAPKAEIKQEIKEIKKEEKSDKEKVKEALKKGVDKINADLDKKIEEIKNKPAPKSAVSKESFKKLGEALKQKKEEAKAKADAKIAEAKAKAEAEIARIEAKKNIKIQKVKKKIEDQEESKEDQEESKEELFESLKKGEDIRKNQFFKEMVEEARKAIDKGIKDKTIKATIQIPKTWKEWEEILIRDKKMKTENLKDLSDEAFKLIIDFAREEARKAKVTMKKAQSGKLSSLQLEEAVEDFQQLEEFLKRVVVENTRRRQKKLTETVAPVVPVEPDTVKEIVEEAKEAIQEVVEEAKEMIKEEITQLIQNLKDGKKEAVMKFETEITNSNDFVKNIREKLEKLKFIDIVNFGVQVMGYKGNKLMNAKNEKVLIDALLDGLNRMKPYDKVVVSNKIAKHFYKKEIDDFAMSIDIEVEKLENKLKKIN